MKWPLIVIATVLMVSPGNAQDSLNHELRRELLEMGRRDQEVRDELMPLMFDGVESDRMSREALAVLAEMDRIDAANFRRFDQIVERYGWPGKDLVGEEAAEVARLIVQHADLERQKRYLPMVRAAARAGDVSAADLARLEDRIRIRNGEKQLYGSNFERGADGLCVVTPIEDPVNVDARRQSVGLLPLSEYLEQLEEQAGIRCRLVDASP